MFDLLLDLFLIFFFFFFWIWRDHLLFQESGTSVTLVILVHMFDFMKDLFVMFPFSIRRSTVLSYVCNRRLYV